MSLGEPVLKAATEGVDSTGIPPVLAGQPGTGAPLASAKASTSATLVAHHYGTGAVEDGRFGDEMLMGRPSVTVCDQRS